MNNNLLRKEDLVNNPTTRVPVCLCLDTSGSMDGDPIIKTLESPPTVNSGNRAQSLV